MEKIRKDILKRLQVSYEEANRQYKIEQERDFRSKDDEEIYKEHMFNDFTIESIKNIEPEIRFCRTQKDSKLWRLFGICTSSIAVRSSVGRSIKFFIVDKTTNKYLGIASIGGDLRQMNIRDDFIDIHKHFKTLNELQKQDKDNNNTDNEEKIKEMNAIITNRTNSIVNIWCCVGLQPVSFNLNIGKLIASLCFSREVLHEYETKYGNKIGGIITHSINGKSIQYSKLKYLEFIGYTKGTGTVKITDELSKRLYNVVERELNINISNECTRYAKFDKIRYALQCIDMKSKDIRDLLNHGQQRGVYYGFINKNSKEFFSNEKIEILDYNYNDIESVEDISKWWKTKWCVPRFNHLVLTNRVKNFYDLRTIEQKEKSLKNKDYIEQKKEDIGEMEYNNIQKDYINNYRKLYEGEELICKLDDIEYISDSYVSGFIDGDCDIAFSNNNIYISIGQNYIRPLLAIQKKYGGMIRQKTLENNRVIYIYSLIDRERLIILIENIIEYSIIKKIRFKKALEYLKCNNSKVLKELENQLKDLQKSSVYLTNKNTIFTNEYLAGIIDSNGCIREKSLYISQKHNQFLQLLKEYIGYGNIGSIPIKIRYECWKKDTYKVLKLVEDKLIVKYQQCKAYISNYEMEISKNVDNILYEQNKELIINFKTINQKVNENIIQNITDKKIDSDNKEQKIPKKPKKQDNNKVVVPNSIDTRTKASISISLARRSFKDEDIDKIRELLNEGKNITYISNELKIGRDTISKIKNNLIFKTTEYTEENIKIIKEKLESNDKKNEIKETLSDEQKKKNHIIASAVGKRTYKPEDVLDLLEYKKNNILLSAEEISSKFESKFSKVQSANLIYGKCLLYEEEFPVKNYTFEDYNKMLEDIKQLADNTKNAFKAIKNRKITKESIINILKLKSTTNYTYQEIADKIEDIRNKEQVRSVLRDITKLYECEFPLQIENELLTYNDYITLKENV